MNVEFFLMDGRWFAQKHYNPTTGKGDAPSPQNFVSSSHYQVKQYIVDLSENCGDYVQRVISTLKGDKIAVLHIAGHGDSGSIELGQGMKYEWVGAFAALKPHFRPEPWAERVIKIYACGLASASSIQGSGPGLRPGTMNWRQNDSRNYQSKGYQFLKTLANVTGIPVMASVHPLPNTPPYFKFEGQTVYVYPDMPHDGVTTFSSDFAQMNFDGNGRQIVAPPAGPPMVADPG